MVTHLLPIRGRPKADRSGTVGSRAVGLRAENLKARSVTARGGQTGVSLIEVLVTVVVLAVGLLGLAGLQSRLQLAQMEAYQRAQALVLLDDMANRIAANRQAAGDYLTPTALGTGHDCTSAADASRAQRDACEWSDALQGAGELRPDGTRVGTLLAGRGCVERADDDEYLVTVAWQGLGPVSAPSRGLSCGLALYDSGSRCANDLCRRAVSTVVRIAKLGGTG